MTHQGHRKARRVGEGETGKLAAKEAARKLQARLVLGDTVEDGGQSVSFEHHATSWLSHIRQTRKHSTYVSYEVLVRRELLPAFGALTLEQVTRSRIKALATASLTDGHAPKTVQNLIRALSSILSDAKEDGLTHENPALRPGSLLPKMSKRRKINPLTNLRARTGLGAGFSH